MGLKNANRFVLQGTLFRETKTALDLGLLTSVCDGDDTVAELQAIEQVQT